MAAVIRSHLGPILLFLQAQVVAVMGWPPERVRLCPPARLRNKDGDTNHPHGDGYCLIWPGQMAPIQDCLVGGGRVDVRLTRTVHFSLRTRFGADEQSDAQAWLTDPDLGHAWLEERLLDAILLAQPNDAGDVTGNKGNWFVTQPAVVRSGMVPELEKLDPDWGEGRLDLDVTYALDVAQSRQ